jgi:hypothetical protein
MAQYVDPEGRRDTTDFADSYVASVLFAAAKGGRNPGRRWRLFGITLYDSYRPELYYMRGPGPRWRAKHGLGA